MTSHCYQHITNNNTQHIFLPCIARTEANTQCNAPVFDASDNTPFCSVHIRHREEYRRTLLPEQQKAKKILLATTGSQNSSYEPRHQLVQHNYLGFVANKKVEVNKVISTPPRKRRQNNTNNNNINANNNNTNGNEIRTQKRSRKPHVLPAATVIQKVKIGNAYASNHVSP